MPWIILGLVVLLVLIGVLAYFANQRGGGALTIEGTPSVVARAPSVGPPPTLAAPTLPPSQPTTTPAPSPTPVPSATPVPEPTKPPPPTAPPPTPPPAAAQGSPAPGAPAQPAAAPPAAAPTPVAAAAPTAPAAAPTPTPFAGQVSNAGGIGNTRQDLQNALGAPTGETPEHLVVFRKDNVEYHVELTPDLNGRASLLAELPPQGQPWTLDAAIAEARKLLPKDVQPPNPPPPEGNNQFVVQRFTSQSLAQALGEEAFTAVSAQPGQMMAVYQRDQSGRITRIVVGIGNDPNGLLNRGR